MLLVQTDAKRFVSSGSFHDRFTAIFRATERNSSAVLDGDRLEGNVPGIFPGEMPCDSASPKDKTVSSQVQLNVYRCNN